MKQNPGSPNLTHATGAPVGDNLDIQTAGPRGPPCCRHVAHREARTLPPRGDPRAAHARQRRRGHALSPSRMTSAATPRQQYSPDRKRTPMFARFSTVAGERGAADAERDIRGFALKFYTEDGNWMWSHNTPVFFLRDPLRFPDLNHAIKRDPRTHAQRG